MDGGRKLSNESHGVSTTRAILSWHPEARSSWTIAPPVSLATSVTSRKSKTSRNSPTRAATARGDTVAFACIGSR
jgi:hypothetical protein